jgi:hypothetical protein
MGTLPTDLDAAIQDLKRERNARHPRALLPGRRHPGSRRPPRRLARAGQARARCEGRRRHLVLRRALHGRDGQDPQPEQDRGACPTSRPAARWPTRCPADALARSGSASTPSTRGLVHQLHRRGEGAERHHLHFEQRRADHPRGPGGPPILFAPDKNLGAWLSSQDRAGDGPVAGHLHRARDVQRAEDRRAEGAAPRREVHRPPRVRAAGAAARRLRRLDAAAARVRASDDPGREYIVGTESGILHTMRKAAPHKVLISGAVETWAGAGRATSART